MSFDNVSSQNVSFQQILDHFYNGPTSFRLVALPVSLFVLISSVPFLFGIIWFVKHGQVENRKNTLIDQVNKGKNS